LPRVSRNRWNCFKAMSYLTYPKYCQLNVMNILHDIFSLSLSLSLSLALSLSLSYRAVFEIWYMGFVKHISASYLQVLGGHVHLVANVSKAMALNPAQLSALFPDVLLRGRS